MTNHIAVEIDESEYEEYLNEVYGTVEICGMTFKAGNVLRELDETAFNVGYADYTSEHESWKCGECDTIYDSEEEADECCKEEE